MRAQDVSHKRRTVPLAVESWVCHPSTPRGRLRMNPGEPWLSGLFWGPRRPANPGRRSGGRTVSWACLQGCTALDYLTREP